MDVPSSDRIGCPNAGRGGRGSAAGLGGEFHGPTPTSLEALGTSPPSDDTLLVSPPGLLAPTPTSSRRPFTDRRWPGPLRRRLRRRDAGGTLEDLGRGRGALRCFFTALPVLTTAPDAGDLPLVSGLLRPRRVWTPPSGVLRDWRRFCACWDRRAEPGGSTLMARVLRRRLGWRPSNLASSCVSMPSTATQLARHRSCDSACDRRGLRYARDTGSDCRRLGVCVDDLRRLTDERGVSAEWTRLLRALGLPTAVVVPSDVAAGCPAPAPGSPPSVAAAPFSASSLVSPDTASEGGASSADTSRDTTGTRTAGPAALPPNRRNEHLRCGAATVNTHARAYACTREHGWSTRTAGVRPKPLAPRPMQRRNCDASAPVRPHQSTQPQHA